MNIETERLILRNYTMDDLTDYWEYVTQPNVGPRCGWQPYTDKEEARKRLLYECGKPLQFAIELKETGKVIGSIEIMDVKREERDSKEVREIGCLLHESYWGNGIMTEALQAIITYCFTHLKLSTVCAGYYEPNGGSGKVQEKCGMTKYDKVKNYITWYLTGEPCDLIMTKIEKEEFEKNPIYKNLKICVNEERRR